MKDYMLSVPSCNQSHHKTFMCSYFKFDLLLISVFLLMYSTKIWWNNGILGSAPVLGIGNDLMTYSV